MGPVKEILDIARRASIALVGVGTVDAEVSRFVQFTALSAEDMKHIAQDCGGVGDINAFVYDIEGNACAHEYADRVLGLTLAELKSIPFRIGVAATAAKALPLYGALRGGYLHALITDETAACGILDLFDQDFRKASITDWRYIMLLEQLREIVWKCNLELPKNGLVKMTSGNVSGRDAETGLVVIKPSGYSFEEMTPADMVVVDLDGKVVEGRPQALDRHRYTPVCLPPPPGCFWHGPYPFALCDQLCGPGTAHPEPA